jgi:hypothetical protein
LALLAVLGAAAAVIHTLQMLGWWKINFGPIEFYAEATIVGALMWAILAAIYIWLAIRLWNVDPQGWMFLVILSILNLIMAFVTILGGTVWNNLTWSIVVNAVILIYCLLPGTKDAFAADSLRIDAPPAEAPPAEPAAEETEE